MILLHGTTRLRAEQIVQEGPNPRFQEPGGQACDDGFSTNLEAGPFLLAQSRNMPEARRGSSQMKAGLLFW